VKLRLNTKILLFFGLLAVISISNYGFLITAEDSADKKHHWIHHTNQVILISERLLGHLRDSETGQRGFLLTRNDNYLEPYNIGITKAKSDFDLLRKLTLDNMLQQTRLSKIQELMRNKFVELEETIQLSKQGKYDDALAIVKSDLGKNKMDAIRQQFSEFISEEERLLELRHDEYSKGQAFLRNAFFIEAVILVLLIMIIFFQIQRFLVRPLVLLTGSITRMAIDKDEHIEKNNKQGNDEIDQLTKAFNNMRQVVIERTSQLEKAHDVLEMRVEERTKDLAKANEVMQVENTERKQAEEKLRQAATVFENATDGIIITDAQGASSASTKRPRKSPAIVKMKFWGKTQVSGSLTAMAHRSFRRCGPRLSSMTSSEVRSGTGARTARCSLAGRASTSFAMLAQERFSTTSASCRTSPLSRSPRNNCNTWHTMTR